MLVNNRPVSEPELYCMVEDMDERQERYPGLMDAEKILEVVSELPYEEEEEEEGSDDEESGGEEVEEEG